VQFASIIWYSNYVTVRSSGQENKKAGAFPPRPKLAAPAVAAFLARLRAHSASVRWVGNRPPFAAWLRHWQSFFLPSFPLFPLR